MDFLDILLVGLLLYQLYKLLKGSVALRIFIGIVLFYIFYELVLIAEMELLGNILGQFMGLGVLAAIILFQPEIRKFLLYLGRNTVVNEGVWKLLRNRNADNQLNILPILDAAKTMAGSNTGALLVFAGNNELRVVVESGDLIDAKISKRLLLAIFNKYSPLHDGAVVIKNNRVMAARCVLPVSDSADLGAEYGMRHRSALGLAEQTDAVVLIVSEETGQMSLALDGGLRSNLNASEIKSILNNKFGQLPAPPVKKEKDQAISPKAQTIPG